VLNTSSPNTAFDAPKPLPERTVPLDKISFAFLFANWDFFIEIVTLRVWILLMI
jgi:hypothetical protein